MFSKWIPWKLIVSKLARSHGFLDPVALLSHARRFAQPSEVVFHARGLMNSRAIQHNLDWIWPYWVNRQFNPQDPAFIPRAFSLTHINLTNRNWTAVGIPGYDQFPIIDPRGLVTPFFDSWSIDAWIMLDSNKLLIPAKSDYVLQKFCKGLA